ncbi:hypothetical protein GS575_12060 [Rhodococcus hoagii]|nr:hypothetical protein [Prescottella equi]
MNRIPTEQELELLILDTLSTLGWSTAHGPDIAPESRQPERQDYREVVLQDRLAQSIGRLNPELHEDSVAEVVRMVVAPESQSPMQENWRAYRLLTQGVPLETRTADGSPRSLRARLVDFENVAANDLLAVNQFRVQGPQRDRRPDIVLFVNGLPLVLLELKRAGAQGASLRGAYNQICTYVRDIPDLFTWNQICAISDGINARAGQFLRPMGALRAVEDRRRHPRVVGDPSVRRVDPRDA